MNKEIRKFYSQALRQRQRAEEQEELSTQRASEQRHAALKIAQQKHDEKRKQADVILDETLNIAKAGDRLLAELNLKPKQYNRFKIPSRTSPLEIVRLLDNQRAVARDQLSKLEATTKELREERRKWWKFW